MQEASDRKYRRHPAAMLTPRRAAQGGSEEKTAPGREELRRKLPGEGQMRDAHMHLLI